MRQLHSTTSTTCAIAATVVLALAACGSGTAQSPDGQGNQVVIIASATMHEPRPSLTPRSTELLKTAARSRDVTDGRNGRSSVAVIASADSETHKTIALTPRRANGAIEHGLQRDDLIARNLGLVADAVQAIGARTPVDLLEGIGTAVRGAGAGDLVLITNGLSTGGGFDLRQVGWNADPAAVAEQLRSRGLLPDLSGWRVLFTGVGETAGAQPPLTIPSRQRLTDYWTAICRAAGAASCEIDESRGDHAGPNSTVAVPIVPVPGIASVTGPDGKERTTLLNDVLGFAGDSAELSPSARELLREYATRITAKLASRPDAVVTVRGYTADPPGSTESGRAALSGERARVVAQALQDGGVRHRIEHSGGGSAPGMTATAAGAFDETIAGRMRRVEITC
ncbi:OmpA family protein [Lentzea sp. BCCO 10_0061]|uniref:OmpA family protein n=1 Tax=Lentzea sokolovensis TaxID=3095429 RepID=A0ABU4UR90_9PSEU|nr:OmpA family protein [Lentzea sp. BCCO 10_0061]MDX8141316.1 OmpA family protein [Lentzea sp. BCCO 10_0061]